MFIGHSGGHPEGSEHTDDRNNQHQPECHVDTACEGVSEHVQVGMWEGRPAGRIKKQVGDRYRIADAIFF